MGITRERFAQGLTYQAWKTQMTRNRERFEDNERGAPLTEQELAAFRSLPRPLHVMRRKFARGCSHIGDRKGLRCKTRTGATAYIA